MGIIQLAQSMSEGSLKTSEMTFILTPVIRAGGNDVTEKDVGQALWGAGLADGMKAIGEIIALVLGSGGDEGNEEEVAQASYKNYLGKNGWNLLLVKCKFNPMFSGI